MAAIEVATRIENLQSGIEGEMYKETHSLYVVDNTPGLWRRLKPLVYRKMTDKQKEGHITCRGVVGDEDMIYTFKRDTVLEMQLLLLLRPLEEAADMFADRDAFLEEENQPPAELPSPKKAVKKPTQQTPEGELPASFK